jgi:RNA-directed DNA polymerase
MQNAVLKNLVYKFKPHPCAFGFIKGRSVKDGAAMHVGTKVLLCADIANFFTSIKKDEIFRLMTFLLKNLSVQITYTHADLINLVEIVSYKGSLPQGSPSSPALANMFCLDLDKKLYEIAKTNNLRYTRYADDLSFSTKDPAFLMFKILPNISKELKVWGLKMNPDKTRILRPHRRMVVTGVVVNDKLGTPKWVWKNIRAQLHNTIVNKVALTIEEYQKLRGQIEWIKTLHPKRGEQLLMDLGKITLKS